VSTGAGGAAAGAGTEAAPGGGADGGGTGGEPRPRRGGDPPASGCCTTAPDLERVEHGQRGAARRLLVQPLRRLVTATPVGEPRRIRRDLGWRLRLGGRQRDPVVGSRHDGRLARRAGGLARERLAGRVDRLARQHGEDDRCDRRRLRGHGGSMPPAGSKANRKGGSRRDELVGQAGHGGRQHRRQKRRSLRSPDSRGDVRALVEEAKRNGVQRRPNREETELHTEVRHLKTKLVPEELRRDTAEARLTAATGATRGIPGIGVRSRSSMTADASRTITARSARRERPQPAAPSAPHETFVSAGPSTVRGLAVRPCA